MRVGMSEINPIESSPLDFFHGEFGFCDYPVVGDYDVNSLILAMLEGKRVPPIKICLSREFHQVKIKGSHKCDPVRTRKKYTIVNGHHRFAAAWMLGLETIPAEICKFMFSRGKKGVRYL